MDAPDAIWLDGMVDRHVSHEALRTGDGISTKYPNVRPGRAPRTPTPEHRPGLAGQQYREDQTPAAHPPRQPEPGTLVWRTKLGRTLITNPSGTFDLGNAEFAHATWCAARQLTSHSVA
jgi:hypothetical protein